MQQNIKEWKDERYTWDRSVHVFELAVIVAQPMSRMVTSWRVRRASDDNTATFQQSFQGAEKNKMEKLVFILSLTI